MSNLSNRASVQSIADQLIFPNTAFINGKFTGAKSGKTFQTINIPKLSVLTTEEGIKQIQNNLSKINDWTNIDELIPKFYNNQKMKKTGLSGIFAASLELTKEGAIKILQENVFEKVLIKKNQ